MPNWCSNSLKITGSKENIASIKQRLIPISSFQQRNALRLVVIHCWYIFIFDHQNDSMTVASKIMDIYDRILNITNNEIMTRDICDEIKRTFLDLKLTVATIGENKIKASSKEILRRICKKSKGDFLGWGTTSDDGNGLWDQFVQKANEIIDENIERTLDFGVFCPPTCGFQVNGFNGYIFDSIRKEAGNGLVEEFPSGSSRWGNINRWGSKWNAGSVEIDMDETSITIYFDTAWSPPKPVIYAITEQFSELNVKHIYAEQGMGYCGIYVFEKGNIKTEEEGELEWTEPTTEDDWAMVSGPDYVLELPHYGG